MKDILLDDGEQHHREFEIEAEMAGVKLTVTASATEFNRMGWVLNTLGPQAIIYPGQQQHARAAIQSLSDNIRQERVFTHLGWRKQGADWLYLHDGGALGADPSASGIQVQIPSALQEYRITQPSDPDGGARAIRDSLRLLDVAPDRISFPLLAGVYRAALGGVSFSLFLAGRSGVFKSTLAAFCQQHFGAGMDATRLPANFASTANSVEALAFLAKDALLVVDDFAPSGLQGDRELHGVAERIFRAAGNRQGRSRMGQGRGSTSSQPPRALVLATGEEVPKGLSIRARLLILEVNPGDVNCPALTECQNIASQGQFAMAMGAFLAWAARRYDSLQKRLRERVPELRQSYRGAVHQRLPSALAELEASFEIFLEFAAEVNAIAPSERNALGQRCRIALNELSIRARLLILEVNPGDVNCPALTECQNTASQGQFAIAMGAFLAWAAERYDSLLQRLRERVPELRQSYRGAVHQRLPSALAELEASFEIFLEFAAEVNAIAASECKALGQRCRIALNELLARQARYHQSAVDPAQQFLKLLRSGIASGRAHVSDRSGSVPGEPAVWGWRKPAARWVPQGPKIGWLAGSDLYLDPAASYEVSQQMAGSERLAFSEQTLRHRLHARNLLASVDSARRMLLVRRTLEARPRQVLHLRARDLLT